MITLSIVVVILSFFLMFISFINWITQPVLKISNQKNEEKVSILIPARNEEKNLSSLLESIKKQTYTNFEVIILDDHSQDDTYKIANSYSEKDQRFIVFKGKELEIGWLGKNWACHQLSEKANGQYLIFLDADTQVSKDLINSSITYLKNKNLKLLSLFPEQITISLGEKIVVPFINHVLLNLLVLHFIKIPYFSSLSAANGQFMLFDANNYKNNLWHKKEKGSVAEDISIIKDMKKNKFKVASLLGNNLIKCRMYTGLNECISGFEKNILLIFGNSIIFLSLYIIFTILNIFLVDNLRDLLLVILFSFINKIFTSLLSNQNVFLNLILHPIQNFFIIMIATKSIYKKITKKEVIWKGRKVILD